MQLVKMILFIILFSSVSHAQTDFNILKNKTSKAFVKNDVRNGPEMKIVLRQELQNPQETMRTFMHAMDRVKKGNSEAIYDAIETLDLVGIEPSIRATIGKITVERLINTIDRISKVNYTHIPTYSEGAPWYFRKQTIDMNNRIHDVEIALHRTNEGWKFTPETVNSIKDYFQLVEDLNVVQGVTPLTTWKTTLKDRMPDWSGKTWFILKNGQWLGIFFVLLFSLCSLYLVRIFANLYLKNNHIVKENRFKSTFSFGLLAFAFTFKFLITFLELDLELLEVLLRMNYILIAVSAVWASLKMVDYVSFRFEKRALMSSNKFDDVLVPMLKKTAKVIVISFGGLLIAHSLTFDIASILAGLGIGGVAVALAAKDTISNLFGSVTVILDRPFNIGDYIVLEKGVEGTVEQVGFRSTRIRTPINSLITMPNSVLANLAIDNYGMRSYRRFKTMLQIEYSTKPDLIELFIEKVRFCISLNGKIEKSEIPFNLYVHELGDSSINILLNVFFIARNSEEELKERHKLILDIISIANEMGVEFAYPTRTLYMKSN